jgi:hypothetical protein
MSATKNAPSGRPLRDRLESIDELRSALARPRVYLKLAVVPAIPVVVAPAPVGPALPPPPPQAIVPPPEAAVAPAPPPTLRAGERGRRSRYLVSGLAGCLALMALGLLDRAALPGLAHEAPTLAAAVPVASPALPAPLEATAPPEALPPPPYRSSNARPAAHGVTSPAAPMRPFRGSGVAAYTTL